MKVIEYPKFKVIRCDCGCIFSIDDENDIKTEVTSTRMFRASRNYVACPVCGIKHYDFLSDYGKERQK